MIHISAASDKSKLEVKFSTIIKYIMSMTNTVQYSGTLYGTKHTAQYLAARSSVPRS